MHIVVCIKQVPDSGQIRVHPVTNTIMRQGVPTIINPYDLFALEQALRLRDQHGGQVTVLTMGPPMAEDSLRKALTFGADRAVLLTDRFFAGSDTLATSYALASAIAKISATWGAPDIVFTGKQTIDGDTAQVGPQTAEKLGIPQVSYVEALLGIEGKTITLRRNLGNGFQEVRGKLPILLTVIGEANEPRVAGVKRLMKYKKARTKVELPKESAEAQYADLTARGLAIRQWDLDTIQADLAWCGRDGSPTKVHRIQSVVLTAKETKQIPATDEGIAAMVHELIVDHTLG